MLFSHIYPAAVSCHTLFIYNSLLPKRARENVVQLFPIPSHKSLIKADAISEVPNSPRRAREAKWALRSPVVAEIFKDNFAQQILVEENDTRSSCIHVNRSSRRSIPVFT